jgi:hypothetical protein
VPTAPEPLGNLGIRFRILNLAALYGYLPLAVIACLYAGLVVSTGCARGEPLCGYPWYDGVSVSAALLLVFVGGPISISRLPVSRGSISIEGEYLEIKVRRKRRVKLSLTRVQATPREGHNYRVRLIVRAARFDIPVEVIDIYDPPPAGVIEQISNG